MKKRTQVFTCVFVFNDDHKKILLGYKKRGLLEEKWNGFGGKVEPGETILAAAQRELQEECGLTSDILNDNGILTVENEEINEIAKVYLFSTSEFIGTIAESNEMRPKWFDVDAIPFHQMCTDHKYWLPLLIEKKKLNIYFKYDSEGKVLHKNIEILSS